MHIDMHTVVLLLAFRAKQPPVELGVSEAYSGIWPPLMRGLAKIFDF